jgi:DNA repair protein RadC
MINSGVCGRGGLSGTDPAAVPSKSGKRAAGVPAQEKTRKTKNTQAGVLKKEPKRSRFIPFYRKEKKTPQIFEKGFFFKALPTEAPYNKMMNTGVYDGDYSLCTKIREMGGQGLFSSPLTLPLEDRPREKLIRHGPESLSDRELLAVFLVAGVKGRNVSALAGDLLERLDREKAIPPIKELCRLTGMGESKAASVAAMLEFGRRKWAPGKRVKSPSDIFSLVRHYADRAQERFLCLSLNGAHEVIAVRVVTIGLVNRTIVHPREVFADPIKDRASAVIVAHNHPSGFLQPSGEDTEITLRLKSAADILGIRFLDHIIFSETAWFSYRQSGKMEDEGRSA